ncbi:MAG: Tad domain-containing protein [Ardenticatenaceae bacterium]|nr:Tad domain-containing protein [Ardenticatenaceae bacterium]
MRHKFFSRQLFSERGQSLVLIAAAMIGLLAFVGIAVDVGFVFAKNSQLQAGVDAAALAGVVELMGGDISVADEKAERFLSSNNIPITDTVATTMESQTYLTVIQETAYAVTVTWRVDLFFLRVIGWDEVSLRKSATAAFFPLTDIYAGARVETGKLSTSNQALFGPSACTSMGDPYSPFNSTFRPPGSPAGTYTYRYRILVPSNYPDDVLRVEIFDPDSSNAATNSYTVIRTNYAASNGLSPTANKSCPDSNRMQPCIIDTDEDTLVNPPDVTLDQLNPFWFGRVDENRRPTPSCDANGGYNVNNNTNTLYELWYYKQNNDGTIQEIPLAAYTGRKDNIAPHDTDLYWVSPGAPPGLGRNQVVPADFGDFEIKLDPNTGDVPQILVEQGTGNRYIYMDVTTIAGSSENGYEIWAGPNDYIGSVSSQGNERNITVLDNPGAHDSRGAAVFAIGTLPMNSNTSNRVDIPLVYINPNYAGERLFIRLFDPDSGTQAPITFFFDSIAKEDWSFTFADGGTDPDGVPANSRCFPSCNNKWLNPPYLITVPGDLENCDYNNPNPDDCTPFYGGRLMANYRAGAHDTYVWQISITGAPYLVK